MSSWSSFTGWLLHSAFGGGLLLLLALPLMRACRQPARRQRLGESALVAALLLCALNLGPSWIPLPVAGFEPSSSSAPYSENSAAARLPAAADGVAMLERAFIESWLLARRSGDDQGVVVFQGINETAGITGRYDNDAVFDAGVVQQLTQARWIELLKLDWPEIEREVMVL